MSVNESQSCPVLDQNSARRILRFHDELTFVTSSSCPLGGLWHPRVENETHLDFPVGFVATFWFRPTAIQTTVRPDAAMQTSTTSACLFDVSSCPAGWTIFRSRHPNAPAQLSFDADAVAWRSGKRQFAAVRICTQQISSGLNAHGETRPLSVRTLRRSGCDFISPAVAKPSLPLSQGQTRVWSRQVESRRLMRDMPTGPSRHVN